jgi:hypothetical protein
MSRRAEQHCCMAIVAARVHFPVVFRFVFEAVQFLDWQRIHVGAQTDRTCTVSASEDANYACLSQSTVSFYAPGLKRSGDEISGRSLFVTQFGVSVDRSSKTLYFSVSSLNFGDQFHNRVSMRFSF